MEVISIEKPVEIKKIGNKIDDKHLIANLKKVKPNLFGSSAIIGHPLFSCLASGPSRRGQDMVGRPLDPMLCPV